jgi:hypothetical protein
MKRSRKTSTFQNNFKAGMTFKNKRGLEYRIEEINSYSDVRVKFLRTGTVVKTTVKEVNNGSILDRNEPHVFGIGFTGYGPYKASAPGNCYDRWTSMLKRCYSPDKRYHGSYTGATVSKVWHNYQNFAKWHEENYQPGFVLDKDILKNPNREYGPDTCVMVPAKINSLFANMTKRNKSALPCGINQKGGHFEVSFNAKYLGSSTCLFEAFEIAIRPRLETIKEVRDLFPNADMYHAAILKLFSNFELIEDFIANSNKGDTIMSWQRRGGGGGNFQPRPRPVLPLEHSLHPSIEACCDHESKRQLKDYATRGADASRDTVLIDKDPARTPIPVPKAAMACFMQFGVPFDHPEYPPISKFDTRHEANHYYAHYNSPIMWQHNTAETDFRHIPGFTRYVVDKHRRVLNAYNGMEIRPLNAYMIELVADGPSNMLSKVNIDFLLQLAYLPLPQDFIDFGFRTYSHEIGLNVAEGQLGVWKKEGVKIKNQETGLVKEYATMAEFAKCENNDFQLMKELGRLTREGLKGQIANVGPFVIKSAVDHPQAPMIPNVDVNAAMSTAPAPQQEPAPQQQQQQQPAPQQQQAPAPAAPPANDDFNFDNVDF